VPAKVPESDATADGLGKPLLKKADSPGAGVATERVRSEAPKVKPAAAPGKKAEPVPSVVPATPAEGETPKKT